MFVREKQRKTDSEKNRETEGRRAEKIIKKLSFLIFLNTK